MSKEKTYNYLTLVTENGDLIQVTYCDEVMDELFDDYRVCAQNQSYWNIDNWTDCTAMFKGIRLSEINMAKVIGTH